MAVKSTTRRSIASNLVPLGHQDIDGEEASVSQPAEVTLARVRLMPNESPRHARNFQPIKNFAKQSKSIVGSTDPPGATGSVILKKLKRLHKRMDTPSTSGMYPPWKTLLISSSM
jgi:hypothetical protein